MAKQEVIIFMYLLNFIVNKVPEYNEIKKNERIFFHLNNSDSSFYAFMKCSDDYEPKEDIPIQKIGRISWIIEIIIIISF